VEITKGTLIDNYLSGTAESLYDVYTEIENNKNPHIYTGLKEDEIDKFGYLVNCARETDETDSDYLVRCMNWLLSAEKSNQTAIDMALSNLTYSSNAEYVPYTQGVGTATVYVIPNSYEDEDILAYSLEEVEAKLKDIVSPDSYIEYKHSEPILVDMAIYYNADTSDQTAMKESIKDDITDYVNSIAI
jgi:hypothetical protein